MRVFLSHASEDKAEVRRLGEVLSRAGVTVWDYVAPATSNLGEYLDEELTRQIASAQYVIAIVSAASLVKPLVHREVTIAVRLGYGGGRLQGVELPGTPDRGGWPTAMAPLAAVVLERARDLHDLERVGGRLLAAMGITHVSASTAHHRLPVLSRTLDEIRGASTLATMPQAFYNELVQTLDSANRCYRAGDHVEAGAVLERARMILRASLPSFVPYYLAIAQVVCDLHVGDLGAAGRRLAALEHHHLRDESWLAARALASLRDGHVDQARTLFHDALERCREEGRSQVEVLANLCLLDDDASLPPEITADLSGPDRLALVCARAHHHLVSGYPWHALDELRLGIDEHDESSVLLLARACEQLDEWDTARRALEEFAAGNAPLGSSFVRVLARCYVATGRVDRALTLHARHLGSSPTGREAQWMEYARILRIAGRVADSRAVCIRLLEASPEDGESFYCHGFAHYLTDERDVARTMCQLAIKRGFHGRPYADVVADDDGCEPNEGKNR